LHHKTDYSSSISADANNFSQIESALKNGLLELIPHCLPRVNNMSKEHKNKRDAKKKPAMTPKEKKAAKLAKKDTRNILGN